MPQELGNSREKKTRFKGIVEEVIEPAGPRPANCEESQFVSAPIIPAEVCDPNPVKFQCTKVSSIALFRATTNSFKFKDPRNPFTHLSHLGRERSRCKNIRPLIESYLGSGNLYMECRRYLLDSWVWEANWRSSNELRRWRWWDGLDFGGKGR